MPGAATKRIKILSDNEIQTLYGLPEFTHEDQEKYFSLSRSEQEILEIFHYTQSKLYFILHLGYFKAKKLFFIFDIEDVEPDIQFIKQKHFPNTVIETTEITKPTRLAHQDRILQLYSYRKSTERIKHDLVEKAKQLAAVCAKPFYVFKELVNFLEYEKIMLPGYSSLQDIVGKALVNEQNRLENLVAEHLTIETQSELESLLINSEVFYELTLLKKEPRNFSFKEITQEVGRREAVKQLYDAAHRFLPILSISNESIKYYASLVEYYSVYKIKRLDSKIKYIYLLCFIFSRCQKIHDNLINCFIYYVNNYIGEAKSKAKERVYEHKLESNQNLKNASKILNLFVDETIDDTVEFHEIKAKAFEILDKSKFGLVTKYMAKAKFDESEYEWNYYDELAPTFKRNLRPLFMNIEFASQVKDDPLIKAVVFLKAAFQKNKVLKQIKSDEFPKEIISNKFRPYLFETRYDASSGRKQAVKKVKADRYEMLVYRLLRNGLASGDIFFKDSGRYKSFEDDLIDLARWENKEQVLKQLSIPVLSEPIEQQLKNFKQTLESNLAEINRRILAGENKHIKVTGSQDNQRWALIYEKIDEPASNEFYEHIPQVGVEKILNFANQHCQFLQAFEHILGKYVKNQADHQAIIACIIAFGTNTGLTTMAEISDMDYQNLSTTANNFIRLETLREANDKISNAMARLPIFKYYDIKEDCIHSSSDGQKFETQISTINARYSPKYFGLKKGVVAYSLVANNIPINAKIIGANEHESHYVHDILSNNTSDISPDKHSTDTHGTNEVNFAILHMFGYQFAPRYKKLNHESKIIYGFKHLHQYPADYVIRPVRKIDEHLIIDEWPNIQRIGASLALKDVTQSTIIRKLSSYLRQNRTKKALWEYDNIIKSIYFLDYIDDLTLRQNVQKALNRGEAYHQLKKDIFYAHSGKFRVKTEQEQQIWSECARLIANGIIFYNGCISSQLMTTKETSGRYDEAGFIQKVSPVAWRHINLYGIFEFTKEYSKVDISDIVANLSESITNHTK